MSFQQMLSRYDRILLCKETKGYFGEILGRDGIGDRVKDGVKLTVMFQSTPPIDKNIHSHGEHYKTVYKVIRGDTVDVAIKLKDAGQNPLVLNLASSYKPGGGWENGAIAQEEAIFYRSTYDLSLNSNWKIDRERTWKYPIPLTGGIYSPDVFVFRGNDKEDYPVWDYKNCRFLDFVAVAALKSPKLDPMGNLTWHDQQITREKIRCILRIAFRTKHVDLLLGALGCGAYRNPPEQIAKMFSEILLEDEFAGLFRNVSFAILDTHNEGNYGVFKRWIEKTG